MHKTDQKLSSKTQKYVLNEDTMPLLSQGRPIYYVNNILNDNIRKIHQLSLRCVSVLMTDVHIHFGLRWFTSVLVT